MTDYHTFIEVPDRIVRNLHKFLPNCQIWGREAFEFVEVVQAFTPGDSPYAKKKRQSNTLPGAAGHPKDNGPARKQKAVRDPS
jgi:hypothetical protein